MNSKTSDVKALQSLENALRLLELFREDGELGVTQIANKLAVSKSTAFRLLSTLEKWHYVRQNEDTGRYRLGMRFAHFGDLVRNRNELISVVHPHLVKLTEEIKEVSYLTALENNSYVRFVDRVAYSALLNFGSMIGSLMPAYCTASGKAMLAFLPKGDIDEYMRTIKLLRLTPTTIVAKKAFRCALAEIREKGYSFDHEESEPGLSCFATPIFDLGGRVIAAISVSGPTGRILTDRDAKVWLLMETARKIMSDIS